MAENVTTDTGAEAEATVTPTKFLQLSVHVAFDNLPIATYPDDGASEGTVKYGPPFIRFPVSLTAEDATVLQNILGSGRIALVGFEVKDGDGQTRFYRSVRASE